MTSNLEGAINLVAAELRALADTLSPADQSWFFDGRNCDGWMDAFITRLRDRYQQPDRIASND